MKPPDFMTVKRDQDGFYVESEPDKLPANIPDRSFTISYYIQKDGYPANDWVLEKKIKARSSNWTTESVEILPDRQGHASVLNKNPLSKSLQVLRPYFITNNSRSVLKDGFEHGGVTAYALLGNLSFLERFCKTESESDLEPPEKLVMVMLLSRLITWCIEQVILPWNPAKQKVYDRAVSKDLLDPDAFAICKMGGIKKILFDRISRMTRKHSKAIDETLKRLTKNINREREEIVRLQGIPEKIRKVETETERKKDQLNSLKSDEKRRKNKLQKTIERLIRSKEKWEGKKEDLSGVEQNMREFLKKKRRFEMLRGRLNNIRTIDDSDIARLSIEVCASKHLPAYDELVHIVSDWSDYSPEGEEELKRIVNEAMDQLDMGPQAAAKALP